MPYCSLRGPSETAEDRTQPPSASPTSLDFRRHQYPDSSDLQAAGMAGLAFFFFDFLDGVLASVPNHQASVLSQPSPAAMGACCLHFGLPLGHFSLT
jgi:hypothetical protein